MQQTFIIFRVDLYKKQEAHSQKRVGPVVFSTKIQEELEKKARSPKSRCSCPEMKNDQDQMTEERGAVPKTSYAGGKFDPKKNVRGGDRKIRGTDADRKAISRAEMKSRAEKERDDATPSTSKAALDQLAKGQLISKCPFGQKTSSKKRKKYFWISALNFFVASGGGGFLEAF